MRSFSFPLIGAGLAAVIAGATAAQAQDTATPFVGPRVEAIVGYDHNRSGSTVDIDPSRNVKQSIDGVLYGAGVGFDLPIGDQIRVGAEGEISGSSAKWDNNNGVPNTFNLGRVKADRDLYVGARVGVVASPQMLIYAKAGYTNARYGLLGTDGTTSLDGHLTADGYRLGAGLEYAITPRAYTKLEYRYSNYSRADLNFNDANSTRFAIDTDRHQVVVGAGLRF